MLVIFLYFFKFLQEKLKKNFGYLFTLDAMYREGVNFLGAKEDRKNYIKTRTFMLKS